MSEKTIQDSELISRYLGGDAGAFESLYHRHKNTVAGYARAMTGSSEEAENIVQEVFLAVIRRAESLRPEGNFRAYLLIRARGLALNLRRRPRPVLGEAIEIVSKARGPEAVATQREEVERLRRALAELPEEQRDIVSLRTHGQMTVKEIAQMLGKPEGTVKSRYRYALAKLREALSEEPSC